MIGSCQYTLNKCFPAFPSLRSCSWHVPNRNTHGRKIGRLRLSTTVCVNHNCIHIFRICESIWPPAKLSNCLKYVTHTYANLENMCGSHILNNWKVLWVAHMLSHILNM